MKVYLAGPMTGIKRNNFPAFWDAASCLRQKGFDVLSPAEIDDPEDEYAALNDLPSKKTWGQFLARDVKLLADDGVQGIVFLPNWQTSRGAKLEATVGLLCNFVFWELIDGVPVTKDREWVVQQLARSL